MKITATALMMLLLAGCWFSMDAEIKEVVRVLSPDGKSEVVIEHVSVGATAAPSYCVFVIPGETDLKNEANRSRYVMGSFDSGGSNVRTPNAAWSSDGKIAVVYPNFLNLHRNRDSITFDGVTYFIEWTTKEPNQLADGS
ncbi:MAG TPA: hypothetical protein VK178_16505 [Opitutaceae bacterium]|nr:hypothetical protein [Opitutaceae bacterium]